MDSVRLGAAYPALERCRVDVVAAFPDFTELDAKQLAALDVLLVHVDDRTLASSGVRVAISRMAVRRPVIALIAKPTSRSAIEAARMGCHGLIERSVPPSALDRAIRAVMQGELAYSRADLSALARSAFGTNDGASNARFTGRERQVITLIAEGSTDEQIGRELGISRSTAHKHVLSAMRRINVKTRSQLVAAVATGNARSEGGPPTEVS